MSSSQKIIGPVESDTIKNHYIAFTRANNNNQELGVEIGAGVRSSDYQLAGPKSDDAEKSPQKGARGKSRRSSGTMSEKKFVPFLNSGQLYFTCLNKDDDGGFRGAAKACPSITSLNRELSTVSFTYDQLKAIYGPYTMRRLLSGTKKESDLKNDRNLGKELSQDEVNALRTALGTLSQVDVETLQKQYKCLGPLAIRDQNRVEETPENGEIGRSTPADTIALTGGESNDISPDENSKEIQGAAELCIRPSKVALMKSDRELNVKYNEMVILLHCNNSKRRTLRKVRFVWTRVSSDKEAGISRAKCQAVAERHSKQSDSKDSAESAPSTGNNRHGKTAVRSAAGRDASSEDSGSDLNDSEDEISSDDEADGDSFAYDSSSITTADDPSMLYPTAATCSYSVDSTDSDLSVSTASDGWWTEMLGSSHSASCVSTGIRLSSGSFSPSVESAQSFSIEVVTADLFTDDVETAEAAEFEMETAPTAFDGLASARSISNNQGCGDESDQESSDLRTAVYAGTEHSKQDQEASYNVSLQSIDSYQKAQISNPMALQTACEASTSGSIPSPMAENSCDDDNGIITSATLPDFTAPCDRFADFNVDDVQEIQSPANLGATHG